ncbi:MAG: HAD-IC family P-type ATPase [Micromonosporaceae bacterium]|jgi:calcium-translocating P-type ATPase
MTVEHRDGHPERPGHAGDVAWHALPAAEVAARLGTGDRGLTAAEVAARQRTYGPNRLEEEPPPSVVALLFRQVRSPLIYILLVALAVTLLLGEFLDASVIAVALGLNTAIGFAQERRAELAVRALAQMAVSVARVVRDGHEREVDSRDLVPGDLVLLEPGTRIPADLRLTRATGLEVDESLLTGESRPVRKGVAPVPEDTELADRHSMAYTGAVVTSGRGRGVAVATGAATELGAIAGMIRREPVSVTPLQARMARFARLIGLAVAVSAATAFAVGLAVGEQARQMFRTAVALAVAAVPEGLPVVVTVALALGVHRMARRNAIVRRLNAVETLGSTTVIGSDKTGTLTENRMRVRQLWVGGQFRPADGPVEPGSPVHQVLVAGVLANEAQAYLTSEGIHATGDPTDVALLVAAMDAGLIPAELREEHGLFAEIPFEPERRYCAAVWEVDGEHMVYAKGGPERIMAMCDRQLAADGTVVPLDHDQVAAAASQLAAQGLRVLATAHGRLPEPPADPDDVAEPEGLVLLGLVGMMDPPREGVAEAVAACQRAGIRVIMITGDHAATGSAIAARLGIAEPGAEVLTGAELERMDDEELDRRVGHVAVYARTAPEHKLRIVDALKRRGEVVAVTGDGVNDAPALKAAAIGVAMGRSGTDVAREAADIVLTDDNFVSIASAVEEGRVAFDNIRKAAFFLISTGAATVAAILVAMLLGWPLLMLPAQLLWLNLVTNGLQDLAMAFEPGERDVLRRRPRPPGEGILSRVLWWRTGLVGLVMAAGTLTMFWWSWYDQGASVDQARTVALTTMVVFQAFHLGNARAEHESTFRISPLANRFLLISSVAALTVHVGALYLPPTQWLLRVEPISADAWLRLVPVALSIVVVVELEKLVRRTVRRRRARRAGDPPPGATPATWLPAR